MSATIRLANENDAPLWLDLLKGTLGEEYPAKIIYDPAWVAGQIVPPNGHETWVADVNGRLQASISFLKLAESPQNPVANLGRNFFRHESYSDGAAEELLHGINQLASDRGQMFITRIPASDNEQQILFERLGYVCVGFQPFKHIVRTRQGILFYAQSAKPVVASRQPLSESLPQVAELAAAVLDNLKIPNPMSIRDGATGYPLQTELQVHDATYDDLVLWRTQAQASNPAVEVSSEAVRGAGLLRVDANCSVRALLGQRESQIVAGLAFLYDELDRCVRIMDCFATDDISVGALLQHAVKIAQDQLSAAYVEVDILVNAPRLLKTSEQLGFVPVAYLPAFYNADGRTMDVVKTVKLNVGYTPESANLTSHAVIIAKIIDQNLQDLKVGVAVINLLRTLPIFVGLGDGELRKIARLFTQKLYRPGEQVFNKGQSGEEAYVVMRGQVDICLDDTSKPIATLGPGQIFGELAFLDGSPRTAMAIAGQASILLVVQRAAFGDLVQREPHLGMMVMKNIAQDLSNKLRKANVAISGVRK